MEEIDKVYEEEGEEGEEEEEEEEKEENILFPFTAVSNFASTTAASTTAAASTTSASSPSSFYPFKCPACSKGFIYKNEIKRHKKQEHPNKELPILYCCQNCSGEFRSKISFLKHKFEKHPELKNYTIYKCTKCSEVFCTKQKLQRHTSKKHPAGKDELPKKSCPQNQQNMQVTNHQNIKYCLTKTNAQDCKYQNNRHCNICKIEFRESVEIHFKLEHGIFKCKFCYTEIIGIVQFEQHLEFKHNDVEADKRFDELKEQLKEPLKVPSYFCTMCQQVFLTIDKYNNHVKFLN